MSDQPVYLRGRGRGRGRGRSPASGHGQLPGQKNGHNMNGHETQPGKGRGVWRAPAQQVNEVEAGEKRFEAAKHRLYSAVQRHLEKNNLDAGDSSDDDEALGEHGSQIMDKMVSNFTGKFGSGDVEILGKTHDYLINFFQSGSNVCLVCLETMKKTEAVWSCSCCYCIFHLACIQKWVRDGVYQKSVLSPENFPERDIPWYCPKCRYEYSQSACPSRYTCYCGKVPDPPFDPWLVPHSCGEVCDRNLRPACGHRCLLPCHPGPCPPCPKTVTVACHCGRRKPEPRRCGNKLWSCGGVCQKLLACGHHQCNEPCHPGECKPCPRSGPQKCVCGREEAERPCASPRWQCEKPCGRPLLCGHHRCERVCHSETCGLCPRSQDRRCPCGKSDYELDCTEDAPTCGDTCDKVLDCGLHPCVQRCHYGPCGTCREMTEKRCRCGSRVKSIQCYKDYYCETRCPNHKSCGKHQCKRKCCDGSCPPCELTCGKSLPCKNHKCNSPCHTGPCYPCPLTTSVSCKCGRTKVVVPCGMEKITKPPRCKQDCQIPPDCHHPSRTRHRCHFGVCPPCRQICDLRLAACEHSCPSTCHSAVRRLVQEKVKRAGPWEAAPEIREEVAKLPCPPCQVPVQVECRGKHETSALPCSELRPYSCARPCGRRLACGNHQCLYECHQVLDAPDNVKAGKTCSPCEEPCSVGRPQDCTHACPLPCHPPPCPPCKLMIRMRCHCQVMLKHVVCHKWNGAGEEDRVQLKACGGACPKTLSCGHACTKTCHPAPCPSIELCRENVSLKCPCKRRKKTATCNDVRSGNVKLECDDVCAKQKEEKRKNAEEEERQRQLQNEEKQKKELEEYERKTKGRHRQRKRRQTEELELSFLQKYGRILLVSGLVLILAAFTYHVLQV